MSMPTLLYRYILGDLLRVFLLTAAVLVTVIAFGATIKPLTSEGLLGIADTLKYLVLAIVPMLQFALPFSAGFASTLVLHRMTSGNEIVAAAASGFSYQKLLAPIVAMGLVLTLIMVVLTQAVIPRFLGLMGQVVTADITRLFETSIDSGQPFQMGNLQIYADTMWVVANPRDTQADTRLILSKVVAAELSRDGRIETDVTANQAVVDIHRVDGQTYLRLILTDTVAFDGSPGQLARLPQIEPAHAIAVPTIFRDEMGAMTRSQLLALRIHPDTHHRVRDEKIALAEAIRSAILWTAVSEHLRDRGSLMLSQAGPGGRSYVVEADAVDQGVLSTTDGRPVLVRQYEGQTEMRRIEAATVTLLHSGAATLTEPTFEIELLDAVVTDLRGDAAVNRRERLADQNLVLAGVDAPDLSDHSAAQLLAVADAMQPRNGDVQDSAGRLRNRLQKVDYEISARLMMRYAQSATALLLLTIGATLAMWLRGAVPLVIYLWAFVPSILALILISGGDKMMRDGTTIGGLSVMWSGNAALVAVFIIALLRLRRN